MLDLTERSAMKRRDFVKTGIAAWTAASASRVFGANERLRVGLIGCGGRGTFDARLMRGTPEDIQAVAPENYHNGNLDPRLKRASQHRDRGALRRQRSKTHGREAMGTRRENVFRLSQSSR